MMKVFKVCVLNIFIFALPAYRQAGLRESL
jgi:hypothetical protein